MATIETRRSDDGAIAYRVKVRLKGHSATTATFSRLTDARRWAQDTESAIRAGRYFQSAEARRHTVADLVDRYIGEVLPHKPRNASNTALQLAWWMAELGPLTLADLTGPVIAQYRDRLLSTTTRRGKPMSPSTVVRYLAALSHALTVAARDWGWLDDSPMRKVSKPREPRGRERFLSDDERQRLLEACKASTSRFLYPVVVLAISTGMRSGEIMNLRWEQVDLARGHIVLTETKNGSSRGVPLVGHALEVLKDLAKVRRIDTSLLFHGKDPCKPIDLKKPWTTALRKADIANFRFHDLRHSAGAYLAMGGASTIEIAAVLGHKTLAMVRRYSHVANSHTAAVVTAMNNKIFGGAK